MKHSMLRATLTFAAGAAVAVHAFTVSTRKNIPTRRIISWTPGTTLHSLASDSVNCKSPDENVRANSPAGEKKHRNPWEANDTDLLRRSYSPSRFSSMDRTPDYVCIGSGIGGMYLAACLAKFNISTLILEQHYTAGGLQHTFRSGGYEFVPGLHYIANLQLCAPLYDMVADANWNITYKRAGDSVPADEHGLSSHDLKIGDMAVMHVQEGTERVREELCRHFPEESVAIDRFLAVMERAKWQAGQFSTFKIFPRWLQFLTSQFLCSTYIRYASMTTEEALSEFTSDGRLMTVLSAFGGDLGESIADGSFAMQAAVLGHVIEGCYYPEGGPPQFARGLVPTIRKAGGDVLVNARVDEILIERGRATGVRMANGDIIRSKAGVVSDAGFRNTLFKLLPKSIIQGPLARLAEAVNRVSGGISHVFTFVGFNATNEELGLRSCSFYYIPCNVSRSMDASKIQDFYRDTLLDPHVEDVSAGIVFASAKDPYYSSQIMPGKSTAIIFSEARDADFLGLMENADIADVGAKFSRRAKRRSDRYNKAKEIVKSKMMRSLLLNFPHVEPFIDVVEVATPLTMLDFTLRTETLGLRHTPQRMCDMELRPDCNVPGLYFTGQDVSFAGWAGSMTGAMVTAQRILGYSLVDFMKKKTLMRDLGAAVVEDMIQRRVQEGTASTPIDVLGEVFINAVRHIQRMLQSNRLSR